MIEHTEPQGSPEWHALRKSKRPASMSSWLTGTSKYSDVADAYGFYTGAKPKPISEFQQKLFDRGHSQEELARPLLELQLCLSGRPGVFSDGDYLASLDFWGEDGRVVEIKAPKDDRSATWRAALEGVIEPQYQDQLEHQSRVMGTRDAALYVYLGPTHTRLIPYQLDDQRWGNIRRAWDSLFECIARGVPPGPVEVKDPQLGVLLDTYGKIDENIKQLEANLEAIRAQLIAKAADNSITGFGWALTRTRRGGTINYSEAVAELLPGVDLERFRGEPSAPFYKIARIKKGKAS